MGSVQTTDAPPRPSSSLVRAVGWLAATTGVGTGLLAVGHSGVTVPGVSALGPGGSDPVWPAAVAFAVATALFATIAVGALRGRAWAWPLATVTNALVLVSSLLQFRGAASAVGIALAAASLVLLLSPPVRQGLLGARPGPR